MLKLVECIAKPTSIHDSTYSNVWRNKSNSKLGSTFKHILKGHSKETKELLKRQSTDLILGWIREVRKKNVTCQATRTATANIASFQKRNHATASSSRVTDVMVLYCHTHTLKKCRVLRTGAKPMTFRLLVRMIYHWVTGIWVSNYLITK